MSDTHPISKSHLTSGEIAGYLDGRLTGSDRDRVESHLADCDDCRGELIEVQAMVRSAPQRGRRAPMLALIGAAAAATMLIAFPWRASRVDVTDVGRGADASRAQPADGQIDSVQVIAPQRNAVVAPEALTLTWRRLGGNAAFHVTLMNTAGDVLWTSATRDSTTTVPDSVVLQPGATYVVYVDALRADGTSTTSAPRSFTIRR